MISDPGPLTADERVAVEAHFSEAEIVELTLAVGLFVGFSKMIIAMGIKPASLDMRVVPAPTPPSVRA